MYTLGAIHPWRFTTTCWQTRRQIGFVHQNFSSTSHSRKDVTFLPVLSTSSNQTWKVTNEYLQPFPCRYPRLSSSKGSWVKHAIKLYDERKLVEPYTSRSSGHDILGNSFMLLHSFLFLQGDYTTSLLTKLWIILVQLLKMLVSLLCILSIFSYPAGDAHQGYWKPDASFEHSYFPSEKILLKLRYK